MNASTRLFRDECPRCGEDALFTGRFAPPDADGRTGGLFYCPRCKDTGVTWKPGLHETWQSGRAWILQWHRDTGPSAELVPVEAPLELEQGLARLWHWTLDERVDHIDDPDRSAWLSLTNAFHITAIPLDIAPLIRLRGWLDHGRHGRGRSADAIPLDALVRAHARLVRLDRPPQFILDAVKDCKKPIPFSRVLHAIGTADESAFYLDGTWVDGTDPDDYWELWSHDLFDREADASRDTSGHGLESGLAALWMGTLRERVTAEGRRGFISFELRWDGERIRIPDDFDTLGKLRAWLVDDGSPDIDNAPALLRAITQAHARRVNALAAADPHESAARYNRRFTADVILEAAREHDTPGRLIEALESLSGK